MTYDRATGDLANLNKNNGLTEVNVTALAHAYSRDMLIVGYRSGAIDLVEGNRVTTIDGLRRADLSVNRAVLGIDILPNAHLAYITGEFGFIVIDLDRKEVKLSNTSLDPTGSNRPITALAACYNSATDTYYLATGAGVKYIQGGLNQQNSQLWRTYTGANGLPGAHLSQIRSVAVLDGQVYALYRQEGVYLLTDSGWTNVSGGISSIENRGMKSVAGRMILATGSDLYRITAAGFTKLARADTLLSHVNLALQDEDHTLWVADGNRGLVKVVDNTQLEAYQTSSPGFENVFRLYGYQKRMAALSGGYTSNLLQNSIKEGIGIFDENNWSHLTTQTGTSLPKDLTDIVDAAYDTRNKALYLACWGPGIVVIPDDKSQSIYVISDTTKDTDHNTLISAVPSIKGLFVRVGAVDFDANGNLWAANFDDKFLHLRDLDNNWFNYYPSAATHNFGAFANRANGVQITIDDQFNKYIRQGQGETGVIVTNQDASRWGVIDNKSNTGGLPNKAVNDMAIDKDGAMWLATGTGMAVLYNPSSALPDASTGTITPFNATLPIFDGRPLLENDVCTSLVLDGGDRKWVGTQESGVWLFDKDVTKVLAHYTADNSPLPSNNIQDMAILPSTGELFIATPDGLVSLGTAATDATLEETSNACVRIYPNPVRPGYTGNIAIECLPENAIVKITDAAGRLVFEGKAAGGGIVWTGYDYQGRRPHPGMYLIYAYAEATNSKVVGRFAVVE